ncbi:LptA/OstA family protein [Profundibacterium mesophilum]|uniref:LptA/OstA family protein n=1 Tax=Profundibacterium mesophilum TaxID=1258573 RepID=UPI00135BDF60|nr:LptA/OstA family protein [Profundibacterium mesophilum]
MTRILVTCIALSVPAALLSQGAEIAFGGLSQDTGLPVEVGADKLEIDQADGAATFTGNVEISQGEMVLTAGRARVIYGADGAITEMQASEGVTLVNGGEAAEAAEAVYSIEAGTVVMTGDVILTQGSNALSSQRLVIDLARGTGTLEGRVRTIFQPGAQ